MSTKDITIQVSGDLNQVITQFIQRANGFASHITVNQGDIRVNAKSLLGLLSMGLQNGMVVTLAAEGPDEEESLSALSGVLAG